MSNAAMPPLTPPYAGLLSYRCKKQVVGWNRNDGVADDAETKQRGYIYCSSCSGCESSGWFWLFQPFGNVTCFLVARCGRSSSTAAGAIDVTHVSWTSEIPRDITPSRQKQGHEANTQWEQLCFFIMGKNTCYRVAPRSPPPASAMNW